MKCFVYRNLHKPGYVYSIKALEGQYKGKVVGYCSAFSMLNVQLHVSKSGRSRALRENQRNVHAGLIGYIARAEQFVQRLPCSIDQIKLSHDSSGGTPITYNPWKYETFVNKQTLHPVHNADWIEVRDSVVNGFNVS